MVNMQLVMRLGKPMEHLQAALRASASDGFSAETLLFIARHVGYFAFLSYDAIAWVCALSNPQCLLHSNPMLSSVGTCGQIYQPEQGNSRKSVEKIVSILVCRHLVQFAPWKPQGKSHLCKS
jgi:hypothetical protein